jgi:hypothetical protein
VDLAELDAAVAGRASAWRSAGVAGEVIRWPVTDMPAASLRVTHGSGEAELILWVSGEAEASYGSP